MDQGLRAGVLEGIGIRQWIISFKQLPLQVDFTNGLGNLPPDVIVQSDILSPENVPGAQDYPDAEFVQRVRDITQNGQPINYFFSGLGNEARLLGVTGAEDSPISLSALGSPSNFPNQYPLTFGKQMDPIEVPVGDFLPGMGVAGSFMMTGSVDAWGMVQVPAGSFETPNAWAAAVPVAAPMSYAITLDGISPRLPLGSVTLEILVFTTD